MEKKHICRILKKKRIIILTISLMFFYSAVFSFADEISFRCTVKHYYELKADGQLIEKNSYPKGCSFVVEKSTGKIIGDVFDNTGDYQVKVIGNGSGSYKVFSFSEKRNVAESLSIITRQEGKQKPFVGIDFLQAIATGTCD